MIEKHLARDLIPLINSDNYVVLQDYIKSRQEFIKDRLIIASDINEVSKLQGAYLELDMIAHLKEHVNTDKV